MVRPKFEDSATYKLGLSKDLGRWKAPLKNELAFKLLCSYSNHLIFAIVATLSSWELDSEVLEAWLALTQVKYHDNTT